MPPVAYINIERLISMTNYTFFVDNNKKSVYTLFKMKHHHIIIDTSSVKIVQCNKIFLLTNCLSKLLSKNRSFKI